MAIDLERDVVQFFFFCRTLIDIGRPLSLINVGVKTYAPQNGIFSNVLLSKVVVVYQKSFCV